MKFFNNTNKPYPEVCGIPNEEDKLECNMCGKWFKGINKHKYDRVRKFKNLVFRLYNHLF